jgi:hypothetical protein
MNTQAERQHILASGTAMGAVTLKVANHERVSA